MEPEGEWFGEDFGQKIDLTVRIREILRNYPEGTSILKELVQNADDAGAREVRLCLDLRQHSTAGLPSPKLEQFQGPALLVYNDGVFTDTDFRSIQRIGDSLKKDTSKGGKTGRFGIGFNSVYHLTELPAFVSAGKWCSFDPQAKFLPNVNPSNPGKMVDFLQYPDTVQRYPDQFSPLKAFGCDLRSNFKATLFRFPLRTEKQALASRLSKQWHGVDDVRALLHAFAKESAGMLLFLKNVERMSVFEWGPGQSEPQKVHATFVPSPSATLRQSRAFALSATPEKLAGGGSTTADYVMDIVSEPSQNNAVREKWQVCNQLGGRRATEIAGSEKARHMRLVPWAGVAARLSTNEAAAAVGGSGERPVLPRGAAYCFLPLPVVTGLPVHVNGYFELSSNRRDIWHGDDMAGDGELRARWNKALVEELAASCYSRVLVAAKDSLGGGDAYEALWPTGHTAAGSMWRGLADSLMALAKPLPLLKTRLRGGTWVAPTNCVVWAAGDVGGEGGGAEEDDQQQHALAQIMLEEKVPLIEGSRDLRKLLLSSGCASKSSTPAFVRRLFKSIAARPRTRAQDGTLRSRADSAVSLRLENSDSRKNCMLLLHYCLADLSGGNGRGLRAQRGGLGGDAAGNTFKELAGLPLVPLANGSHGVFRKLATVDSSKLDQLKGMGFSETRSRQALVKHAEVLTAFEWLSSGGDGDIDDEEGEGRRFVLCSTLEADLLIGAGAMLVSEASLGKVHIPGVGDAARDRGDGQAVAAVGDDFARVLRALRSSALQSALNVTSMKDDLLPDLIGQTLPVDWRAGSAGGAVPASATAFSWTPGQHGHPELDWFRQLWGYLASTRPSAVRLLAESYPVVPTGEAVVCPLSLRSAVIDGGRLGNDVRSVLVKAGCRTLLPGVFAGGLAGAAARDGGGTGKPIALNEGSKIAGSTTSIRPLEGDRGTNEASRMLPPPPVELFEYVRPGTRDGVLAALGTAQRSARKPFPELMLKAGAVERDALREFLAREAASAMSDVEVAVCRALPILPLHEDGLAAARTLAKSVGDGVGNAVGKLMKGSRLSSRGNEPLVPAVPLGGGSYGAADDGQLYLLLEAGTGFVGVGGNGTPGTPVASTTTAASPKWLETHLLTPRFVKVGGSGAGREGAAEAALLERLGAELIGRATFFVDHVFPIVKELPDGLRNAAMVEALVAAPRLSQQHQEFRSALAELAFVPAGNTLERPRQVFDPEVPELPALLPESRFPNPVFRHPDIIAALRPLGLQSTLDWQGLVDAAASVNSLQDGVGQGKISGAGDSGTKLTRELARDRGRALLTYMDTHEARLFELKKDTPGLFKRMANFVYADEAAEDRERKRRVALARLASLSWVPVLESFPSPLVPTTAAGGESDRNSLVVAPVEVRLRDDMWLSSRTFFVIDAEVRSSSVRAAFLWDKPLDPVVVARQVTGLAETFSANRKVLEASATDIPSTGGAVSAGQGVSASASPRSQDTHTLEGHRQTMAGVVPRLYQLLSNAVEADDARGLERENEATRPVVTQALRSVLHGASWLWVGDAFVPADQVAFTSPANAAPYLYAVPPDLACFGTLLRRFGVRPSFGPSDFCHALRRLAVETGAADPVVTPAAAAAAAAATSAEVLAARARKGGGGMVESLVALAGYGAGDDGGQDNVAASQKSQKRKSRVARELSAAQVELAVAMVQVLSDESIRVSDLEVWVPDASGVLALSTDLLYNDAPWLPKQGHAPSTLSKGKPVRFVHPKVSMAVGEKVGVGSLRRSMVDQSLSQLDFGLGVAGESFGQQESLTRRLKHILQMYPEGPSILSELVQNADDAGARTVRIMLNTREYGDGSLLSPAMSSWQGPSLYVYNDAIFTERDFQNLAKIGQASKLDKLAATGRFGLGFNSVYHFTDLPSFVSGEHLVMFDPHTKYVPGATSVQPGIKIRFAETDLLAQFPDQFSPYCFFGCELKNRFDGTLFRFPLRMAAAARDSEISQASYSSESVMELLNQFKEAASRYLLFLRHVQRIEMYTLDSVDTAPVLRYSVEVTKRDPPNGWLSVPSFVSGPPRRPLSKEAFFAKLGQTPDAALPKVEQTVTITYREEAQPQSKGGTAAAASSAISVAAATPDDESSASKSERVTIGDDEQGEKGGEEVIVIPRTSEKAAVSTVDVFLVCAAIGGGEAKKMACLPQHRHMKLIPWGGVAAHISRNSNPPPSFTGHAFCFLPLPVNTLLPVHLNGFFELSSNRRDIWFGEDMAGEGKRRSEWNTLLLRDVIAPIYASLVASARDIMGAGPQHQALLPSADTPKPWETVVAATYTNLKSVPVLCSRTETSTGTRRRWIAPGNAVVVDEVEEKGGGGGEEMAEYLKRLSKILLWDSLPVVRLPASLKRTMLHYNCLKADATPAFLRSHFGEATIAHPCLGLDAGGWQSSTWKPQGASKTQARSRVARPVASPTTSRNNSTLSQSDDHSARLTPANREEARSNALFLLKAAATGLSGDTFSELVGLPLLPLADGSLGRFRAPWVAGEGNDDDVSEVNLRARKGVIFVCSRTERRLLAGSGLGGEGGGAGHRLLTDLDDLDVATKTLLMNDRLHSATNVAVMKPADLAGMLDAVFPEAWKGLKQVAWAPGSRDVRPKQPSEDWVYSLWNYICKMSEHGARVADRDRRGTTKRDDGATIRLFERAWPLLPATGGVGPDTMRVLLELHPGMPVVSPLAGRAGRLGDEVKKALSQIGVWILDASALKTQADNPLVLKYANPCNPGGVLSALQQALFPPSPVEFDAQFTDDATRTARSDTDGGPDLGPGGGARRRIDNRFQSVGLEGRDALRAFFCRTLRTEDVTPEQIMLLKGLPIFRIHGASDAGSGSRRDGVGAKFTSILGAEKLLLAPRNADPALLGPEFAAETESETEFLESLGVQRVGKGAFFRQHILPKAVDQSLPVDPCRAAVEHALANLEDLCKEDKLLEGELRYAPVVTDGGGEAAIISDLFDPAVDELPGLLGPEAFPADYFRTPAALAGMRSLGLQSSLTCEGVLQSARSIEAAFLPPVSSTIGGVSAATAGGGTISTAALRADAFRRSRKLLNFVDRRADQLLLVSGENGQWFVDPRRDDGPEQPHGSGGNDVGDRFGGTVEDANDEGKDVEGMSVSSGSEAENSADEEERKYRLESTRAKEVERKERAKARVEAAAAAWRKPPPNDFVEELTSIAWLPVYARSPNDLLPWKVQRPDAQMHDEAGMVSSPFMTRPESEQWFCSLRLSVLEGDVKSRSLQRAFGWDKPIPGLVLAVQLVSLSKKFEKLKVFAQQSEMKRKMGTVTSDIYNSLDLLIGSTDFAQVKTALADKDWLWVGDKFTGSNKVAFEVPSAALSFLSAVPEQLLVYSDLLTELGVPPRFSPRDYVEVLRRLYSQSKGRPLDPQKLDLAVGMVKILSQLSAGERASIEGEVVMVPAMHGPLMYPAADLVYNDAPWLMDRLRQSRVRLVHPDVGDEAAKAVGVRSVRETVLSSQGGTQSVPCPIAREIGQLLGLSTEKSRSGDSATGTVGTRWLHDVLHVAESLKADRVEVVLDEEEYPQQSLLHPALADTQGPSVCVVLPGKKITPEQLVDMLTPSPKPWGGNTGGDGFGRPPVGDGIMALFAVTDCLQVLSDDSLYVYDPCGEYLFTAADKQTPPRRTNTFSTDEQQQETQRQRRQGQPRGSTSGAKPRARRPASASSPSSSSSSSTVTPRTPRTPRTPSPSGFSTSGSASSAGAVPRSLTGFSTPSSTAGKGGAPSHRVITGVGGGSAASRSLVGGSDSGTPGRDPIGRRFVVRREDVFTQFPDQYSPFLALPGGMGETIREGLSSGRGFDGTVFRMSLRTRAGDISGSTYTGEAVERELKKFSRSVPAGLVMSHYLQSVHASVLRKGQKSAGMLFSSNLRRANGRGKRRTIATSPEWRKSSLNVMFRGFSPPRGAYNVTVSTTSVKMGRQGDVSGGGVGVEDKEGMRGVATDVVESLEEMEDQWVVSYVLAPSDARTLALSLDYASWNLTPLMTCASLVSRRVTVDGQLCARKPPTMKGTLFVGQNSCVRTGLPFHVDGPFFISRKGKEALLSMDMTGVRAPGHWNQKLFGSVCTELVPEHMLDLKNELSGRDPASLYRFWPSAKRALMPFSGMLPGQMYLRLGELPLYLSRSTSEGVFKRMKDGYFKTQAVSAPVEEYIRRHVDLFSVPHTVTEDLARQPTVSVNKITPASVRYFLRRSKDSIATTADDHSFRAGAEARNASRPASTGGMSAVRIPLSRGNDSHQNTANPGTDGTLPSGTDLLLELLEFCLSDCPPLGERPPGVAIEAGGGATGEGNDATAGDGGAEQAEDPEVVERNAREAREARLAVADWEDKLRRCKVIWKELYSVQLLPLASGGAGGFGSSFAMGRAQRYVLASRRQHGLMRQLKGRLVNLKAARRLSTFFECDHFLQTMGIVRFTPAFLANNLDLILPRGWKGQQFVRWSGGTPSPASASSSGNPAVGGGGNDPPKAGWLALFWSEVSLLDASTLGALGAWPLVPITTGELVSCSMLQKVVRACPSMLNGVRMRGLGVALATVHRAEAAADEKDEKELQEVRARQALESDPVSQGQDDQDQQDEEEEDDVESPPGEGGEGRHQNIDARPASEMNGDSGTDSELQSVGDASPGVVNRRNDEADVGADRSGGIPPPRPSFGHAGDNAPGDDRTPPRLPAPSPQAEANVAEDIPPPPPAQQGPQGLVAGAVAAVAAAVAGGSGALARGGAQAVAAAVPPVVAPPVSVPEPPRLKGLVTVLKRLGVPVLELAFFPREQRPSLVVQDPNEAARGALHATHAIKAALAPPYPISEACEGTRRRISDEAQANMRELIASGNDHGRDNSGRKLRLRWGALSSEDMDALLQGLSKPSDSGAPIVFPESEQRMVRDLPVWKTLSGKRVAVERGRYFSLGEGGNVANLPLPPGAADRLLAPTPELSDFIRDIGVEEVTHSGVVTRFVLPELGAVSPEDRRQLLEHVREHWATLKNDGALVDALKEVAFIPVGGVMNRARTLFDPRNEMLKDVFVDEPNAFPTGEFAEPAWLDLLVDVGLKTRLDRDTILACATKVASQRADPLPPDVAHRATNLMKHVIGAALGRRDLYDNAFLLALSRLRFVPVHIPPPNSGVDGDGGAGDDGDGLGGMFPGGDDDDAWSGGVVLLRFDEAAVPRDRHLVFTAYPVHMDGLVPPQLYWSSLKIQSPPPLEVVLRHVKIITDRHVQLDRWRYPQTPVKVFQSIFEYLDENWSKLSPAVMKGLKERPLVPVGARLIKAGRLFFRLKENLSPFMFEVPRAFGAFDSLFKNLGTTQAPTASDYAIFLKELAGECGSQALNPNELGAVLKVLSLLAAELEADTAGELSTDIYVPDENSELVPWNMCLYDDSPSLAGRVDPSRLRCLHPRVSLEDCRRLSIPSVSQVVKEDLELGFQPVPYEDEEDLQAQLSLTLSSKDIGVAVAVLVKQFSPGNMSLEIDTATVGGGANSGGARGGTFEARAHAAAAKLEGFVVVFVKELRSRFLRMQEGEGGLRGEEDITAVHGATGSVFFVREANKTILVARGALPAAFPPSYAVAMAVSKLVSLPAAAIGPLSVLLATKPDGVEGCLSVLQVRQGAVTGDELARGLPGEPLTEGDRKLVELKPLKAFLPGEVVAWEDKGESSSDEDNTSSVMRYGVVIIGGSVEAGDEGDDDETVPGDGSNGREGLRYVRVKLTPGKVDTLLSTQVYSFRQARARAGPSKGLAARAAKMLRRIAGESVSDMGSGTEESKSGGSGGARGGRIGGVVDSAQLLNAVGDILGRADLSLSVEQGERLKESLRHKDEVRAAKAALAKATDEAERVKKELKLIDLGFECAICCTNVVDNILAPCGHMLCSSCLGSLPSEHKCPFCRVHWTATAPFRRPRSEDVSDD